MNADVQDSRITINIGCFGTSIEFVGNDGNRHGMGSPPGWADIVIALSEYLKARRDLLVSNLAAEHMIHNLGSAMPLEQERMLSIAGRNLTSGSPQKLEISSVEIREAIVEKLAQLVKHMELNIKYMLPLEPDTYIVLKGDLARIRKLDQRLQEATGLRVVVEGT
jgi:rod shape-determining protein MreB